MIYPSPEVRASLVAELRRIALLLEREDDQTYLEQDSVTVEFGEGRSRVTISAPWPARRSFSERIVDAGLAVRDGDRITQSSHRCVAAAVWMARQRRYAQHRVSADELMEVRMFEHALQLAERWPSWSPEQIATELSKEGH